MILDYFKKIFKDTTIYKNIAHILEQGFTRSSFNSTSDLSLNPLNFKTVQMDDYELNHSVDFIDIPIESNSTSTKEYDFSQKDYLLFHSEFLNNAFFLNEKNKEILQKIHEELTFIKEIFSPFDTQKIPFEIILTGGSVRDFILGKSESIKDLDITISFKGEYKQYLMYQGCSDMASVIGILLKDKEIHYNKLSELKKNFEIQSQYAHMHHLLEEVVEFKGKYFPIQLLCTNNSHLLINNFDFDICKIGLRVFSNVFYLKQVNMPQSLEEYISRLEYGPEFISHVLAKKLSYHNDGKSKDQIISELVNHYPRIAAKYPDFTCDIFSPTDANYNFTKELFDKASIYNKLQHNSEHSLQKNKTRKI